MLDAAYRPHLLEDGFRGMEVVPQSLLRVPDMPHIRGQDQRHEADEHPSVLGGFLGYRTDAGFSVPWCKVGDFRNLDEHF